MAQTADASLRDIELDVFTSFLSAEGLDRDALAFLADAVQCETVAFMARAKAKGKGKSVMQGQCTRLSPTFHWSDGSRPQTQAP